jgi:hypothetical protein
VPIAVQALQMIYAGATRRYQVRTARSTLLDPSDVPCSAPLAHAILQPKSEIA